MATITVTELHPNAGAIWARAMVLWATWLNDAALTWITPTYATVNSRKTIKVTWSNATDTLEWVLMDVSVAATNFMTFESFAAFPDIMRGPPFMPTTIAGRTTLTEFNNKLLVIRNLLTANWTGISGGVYTHTSANFGGPITVTGQISSKPYFLGMRWWFDVIAITLGTATATVTVPGNANLAPKVSSEAVSVGIQSSAIEGIDLTALVTALQDIARRDVATSIDNGNVTVYNFSGDIVEPP